MDDMTNPEPEACLPCPKCGGAFPVLRDSCPSCAWAVPADHPTPNMFSVARDIASGMAREEAYAKAAREMAEAIDADLLKRALAGEFEGEKT